MDKYLNVAIALNEKMIVPAYVMVRSLVINNISNPVCVYVMYSDLTEESRCLLEEATCCDSSDNLIQFIEIDLNRTKGLPYTQSWSVEAYYRLMLPEILGGKIERILYLDVDTIVNKDISDLYYIDFEGNMLIATKDLAFEGILAMDEPHARKRNAFFKELKSNGMTYFCSGVLLMNLKALKENYTFNKYMEIFAQIKDKVEYFDQDLLNYTHYKEVKFVDEIKYGLFTFAAHRNGMTYEEAKENVSIFHFTGQAKPWTVNLIRYDIEKIWWKYAKDTPFYYELLEQIFFDMCESTLAERKMDELAVQNEELRGMVQKCRSIIEKLYPGN